MMTIGDNWWWLMTISDGLPKYTIDFLFAVHSNICSLSFINIVDWSDLRRQAWHRVCPQNSNLGILSPCSWKVSSQTRHSRMLDFFTGDVCLAEVTSGLLWDELGLGPRLLTVALLLDKGTRRPNSSIEVLNISLDIWLLLCCINKIFPATSQK